MQVVAVRCGFGCGADLGWGGELELKLQSANSLALLAEQRLVLELWLDVGVKAVERSCVAAKDVQVGA